MAAGGAKSRRAETGRFLVLAGRSSEVEGLEQVVSTFDVDELRAEPSRSSRSGRRAPGRLRRTCCA